MKWIKRNLRKIGIGGIITGVVTVFLFALNFYIDFNVSQKLYAEKCQQVEERFLRVEDSDKAVLQKINTMRREAKETNKSHVAQLNSVTQGVSNLASDLRSLTYIIIKNNKNIENDFDILKKANNSVTENKDTTRLKGNLVILPLVKNNKETQDIFYENSKRLGSELIFFLHNSNSNIIARK